MPDGILRDCNDTHPSKQYFPIVVKLSGKLIMESEIHPENMQVALCQTLVL